MLFSLVTEITNHSNVMLTRLKASKILVCMYKRFCANPQTLVPAKNCHLKVPCITGAVSADYMAISDDPGLVYIIQGSLVWVHLHFQKLAPGASTTKRRRQHIHKRAMLLFKKRSLSDVTEYVPIAKA